MRSSLPKLSATTMTSKHLGGEGPTISVDVKEAVRAALERAGVEFIPENGAGLGSA